MIKKIIALWKENKLQQSKLQELQAIPSLSCDAKNLVNISENELGLWLNNADTDQLWEKVRQEIEVLKLPEMTGGVNPGDQRAIFYLISAFKPQKVLEIGTHIGCSTVHIALALKQLQGERSFLTVDICDVNDPVAQPWKQYQSPAAPATLIARVNCQELSQFQVSSSLDFFKNSQESFDLIFLDGLHEAYMVYQEIPVALEHLKPGGLILLHDYFPDGKELWKGYQPITGPYLAVKRLIKQGANLRVIPLGELPWITKLGTKITSLAILTRN